MFGFFFFISVDAPTAPKYLRKEKKRKEKKRKEKKRKEKNKLTLTRTHKNTSTQFIAVTMICVVVASSSLAIWRGSSSTVLLAIERMHLGHRLFSSSPKPMAKQQVLRKNNRDRQCEVPKKGKEVTKEENGFRGLGLVSNTVFTYLNQQKFSVPTSIQMDAIPIISEGKDVILDSSTGTGKTLAYLLPLLDPLLKDLELHAPHDPLPRLTSLWIAGKF